jgi:hypothetical protein
MNLSEWDYLAFHLFGGWRHPATEYTKLTLGASLIETAWYFVKCRYWRALDRHKRFIIESFRDPSSNLITSHVQQDRATA